MGLLDETLDINKDSAFTTLPEIIQKRIINATNDNTNHFLDLSHVNLNLDDISSLATLLPQTFITSLDLSFNNLTSDALKLIKSIKQITKLNLSWNRLDDDASIHLAEMENLIELNLEWNQLGAKAAGKLSTNASLQVLNLKHNSIGDIGALTLCDSKTLTDVNLSHNKITESGATDLGKRCQFRSLNIYGNSIGPHGLISILQNEQLRELKIGWNNAGKPCPEPVIEALATNHRLVKLEHDWKDAYSINRLREIISRNSFRDTVLTTVMGKLFAQANRTEYLNPDSCDLGKLPRELMEKIAGRSHQSLKSKQ